MARVGRGGISYDYSMQTKQLKRQLRGFNGKVDRGVAGVVKHRADIMEKFIKESAPWTDRTGAARSGLRTITEHQPLIRHTIVAFYSVTYGIWLEVRWAGRYAVIGPALPDQGKKLMKTLNKLFARLERT